MNTMPLRETVAGEALSMLCGSKTTLQFGAMGIRSPFASVRVLLSSKTELRFSIQMASTGPSRTIQMFSPEGGKWKLVVYMIKTNVFINNLISGNIKSP